MNNFITAEEARKRADWVVLATLDESSHDTLRIVEECIKTALEGGREFAEIEISPTSEVMRALRIYGYHTSITGDTLRISW